MINVLKGIRDSVYAVYIAAKVGYHFCVQRNVNKTLDDLIEYKKYVIKHYNSWTIWDIKRTFYLIDSFNVYGRYGFETRLLAQAYDLMEAEEIRKEFGV